jgi:hypothetical protein
MMVSIKSFYQQHTRRCDWETLECCKEFLDQVQRKGDKLGKRMMCERKQHMRKKYLKVPSSWILGTVNRELNLFDLCDNGTVDDLHDEHDKALAYWRPNHWQ